MGVSNTAMASHHSAHAMVTAATNFLASLAPEQRTKAISVFDDKQRLEWYYTPGDRAGIRFKDLDHNQHTLAHNLLHTGLSQAGYRKATGIMHLELVLRALEGASFRDPDLYYLMIFGAPTTDGTWAWRIDGHHLSLHFTVVQGRLVATTPTFFGANPAEVRQGPQRGVRLLSAEEDTARTLVTALDHQQRSQAIFQAEAFPDIVTSNAAHVDPLAPVGICANQFSTDQITLLMELLDIYASALPSDLAAARMDKLRRADIKTIWFGWAGDIERGQPHYYRLQSPTFLIEYDNTQNDANHIHTVWRDFTGDFGRDLLREHYQNTPHGGVRPATNGLHGHLDLTRRVADRRFGRVSPYRSAYLSMPFTSRPRLNSTKNLPAGYARPTPSARALISHNGAQQRFGARSFPLDR